MPTDPLDAAVDAVEAVQRAQRIFRGRSAIRAVVQAALDAGAIVLYEDYINRLGHAWSATRIAVEQGPEAERDEALARVAVLEQEVARLREVVDALSPGCRREFLIAARRKLGEVRS